MNTTTRNTLIDQWRKAKALHPGMLLLFRAGDFYEVFGDDADVTARLCGLPLTTRSDLSMAGFPWQALESYLRKLLSAGHRVAICEQTDEERPLQREVVKTLFPEDSSEAYQNGGDTRWPRHH